MTKPRNAARPGEALAEGLEQLHDHLFGKEVDVDVTEVRVEINDVGMLRRRLGLSQAKFAAVVGVSVDTIQNWEQGRRSPCGPARAFLDIIARRLDVLDAA